MTAPSCGPGPDRGLEFDGSLLACCDVDDALEAAGGHQLRDTSHARADARSDLVFASVSSLRNEVGVGDHRPHERHHVGHTGFDEVTGVIEGHDPAGHDGRHVDLPGDLLAAFDLVAEGIVEGRQELVEAPVGTHRDVEEVHEGLDVPGDRCRFGLIDTALDEVGARQPHAHREPRRRPRRGSRRGSRPGIVSGSPRAAVAVVAQVGRRREELTDEVAVGTMQLDAVQPAVTTTRCRRGERGDGLVDHRLGHRSRHHVHRRRRDGRGRHGLTGTGVGRATVPQLLEDFRAVHVHPACQLLVEREHCVGEHPDGGGRVGLHARDLDDREADPTSGPLLVVRDQVLPGRSGGVGRAHDAVGNGARTDLERLEEVVVGHGRAQSQRTGSDSNPWSTLAFTRVGAPSGRMRGMRSSTASNATAPSSRDSGAPRQ